MTSVNNIPIPAHLLKSLKTFVEHPDEYDVDLLELFKILLDIALTGEFTASTPPMRAVGTFMKCVIGEEVEKQKTLELRNSPEYKAFRKAVLERDGYECCICGSTKNLHVHHLKSYRNYPELRTDPDNGMTLCANCHREVHHRNGYLS